MNESNQSFFFLNNQDENRGIHCMKKALLRYPLKCRIKTKNPYTALTSIVIEIKILT